MVPNYYLAQINIARILAPIDARQPAGGGLSLSKSLPCIERVALALRIAREDHEEFIRKGEEFIAEWERKRRN